jgi:hypothetical protein
MHDLTTNIKYTKTMKKEQSKSETVKGNSRSKSVIYHGKENDIVIRLFSLDGKVDELHIQIEGETSWTVIGYKDMEAAIKMALTEFKNGV